MESRLQRDLAQIKLEDSDVFIVDDADVPAKPTIITNKEIVKQWERKIYKTIQRKLFNSTTGDTFQEALKEYLKSLKQQAIRFKHKSSLKEAILKHLNLFYLYYDEFSATKCANLNYVEDILLIICSLELDFVRNMKKTAFSTSEYDVILKTLAQRIIGYLTIYLLNEDCRMFHVLLKLECKQDSVMWKDVLIVVYRHYLMTLPVRDYSDESFCRHYLITQKLKNVTNETEHDEIDRILYYKFSKTSNDIRENKTLKSILLPSADSIADLVDVLADGQQTAVNTYFRYMERNSDDGKSQAINVDSEDEELSKSLLNSFCTKKKEFDGSSTSSSNIKTFDNVKVPKTSADKNGVLVIDDDDSDIEILAENEETKQPTIDLSTPAPKSFLESISCTEVEVAPVVEEILPVVNENVPKVIDSPAAVTVEATEETPIMEIDEVAPSTTSSHTTDLTKVYLKFMQEEVDTIVTNAANNTIEVAPVDEENNSILTNDKIGSGNKSVENNNEEVSEISNENFVPDNCVSNNNTVQCKTNTESSTLPILSEVSNKDSCACLCTHICSKNVESENVRTEIAKVNVESVKVNSRTVEIQTDSFINCDAVLGLDTPPPSEDISTTCTNAVSPNDNLILGKNVQSHLTPMQESLTPESKNCISDTSDAAPILEQINLPQEIGISKETAQINVSQEISICKKMEQINLSQVIEISKEKEQINLPQEIGISKEREPINLRQEIDISKESEQINLPQEICKEKGQLNLPQEIGISKEREHLNLPQEIDISKEKEQLNLPQEIGISKEREQINLPQEIGISKEREQINLPQLIAISKEREQINLPQEIGISKEREQINLPQEIGISKEREQIDLPQEIGISKEREQINLPQEIGISKEREQINLPQLIAISKEREQLNLPQEIGMSKEREQINLLEEIGISKEREQINVSQEISISKERKQINLPQEISISKERKHINIPQKIANSKERKAVVVEPVSINVVDKTTSVIQESGYDNKKQPNLPKCPSQSECEVGNRRELQSTANVIAADLIFKNNLAPNNANLKKSCENRAIQLMVNKCHDPIEKSFNKPISTLEAVNLELISKNKNSLIEKCSFAKDYSKTLSSLKSVLTTNMENTFNKMTASVNSTNVSTTALVKPVKLNGNTYKLGYEIKDKAKSGTVLFTSNERVSAPLSDFIDFEQQCDFSINNLLSDPVDSNNDRSIVHSDNTNSSDSLSLLDYNRTFSTTKPSSVNNSPVNSPISSPPYEYIQPQDYRNHVISIDGHLTNYEKTYNKTIPPSIKQGIAKKKPNNKILSEKRSTKTTNKRKRIESGIPNKKPKVNFGNTEVRLISPEPSLYVDPEILELAKDSMQAYKINPDDNKLVYKKPQVLLKLDTPKELETRVNDMQIYKALVNILEKNTDTNKGSSSAFIRARVDYDKVKDEPQTHNVPPHKAMENAKSSTNLLLSRRLENLPSVSGNATSSHYPFLQNSVVTVKRDAHQKAPNSRSKQSRYKQTNSIYSNSSSERLHSNSKTDVSKNEAHVTVRKNKHISPTPMLYTKKVPDVRIPQGKRSRGRPKKDASKKLNSDISYSSSYGSS